MNKEAIKMATDTIRKLREVEGSEEFCKLMSASLMWPFVGGRTTHTVQEVMAKSYELTAKAFERYKHNVEWRYTPNNWRKMHHMPMRRKGA